MPIHFVPKTKPFPHQAEDFDRFKDLDTTVLFWEPGLGKTKEVLDIAAYRHLLGDIDGLFILAPNGVHRNWISDEVPVHMHDGVRYDGLIWYSARSRSEQQQNEERWLLEHKGLAILVMSYDGFCTELGKTFAKKFLTQRRCMFILDEAELIKTPGSKRSKLVRGAGKYGKIRGILTGTPISNSPFDIYAPMLFIDPDFWKKRGIGSYAEFKNTFAIILQMTGKSGGRWEQVSKYRDLHILRDWILGVASRRLKEDCLNLPPKLYSKRYFQMTPAQKKAYAELKTQYITQLDGGEEVTAILAIVRLVRFCQITSGYLPADDAEDGVLTPIDAASNPRLDLLEETVTELPHQAIVWARFQNDFVQIQKRLGDRCVLYYGAVKEQDRTIAIERFKKGDVQFFVANPASIGRGVTLVGAKSVVYYNNSFRLVDRIQSEDRAHRIGQTDSVQYIDLIAEHTVDEKIVKALRDKFDIAAYVTGDRFREWI